MESWQHAAESIEVERQTFMDTEAAFTMKINDRPCSCAERCAVHVNTTWEIQKRIEKQMLSQKEAYKDTIRCLCPG